MTAIQALQLWTTQYDTRRNEAMSLTIATALHLLLFLWNPNLFKSQIAALENPLVEVTMVEMTPGPGGATTVEPPKKMSMLDTLKDMLKRPTPEGEDLSHIAPPPSAAPPAVLPPTPALQDRSHARPMTPSFQPRSQMDDIAAIQTQAPTANANMAQLPKTEPSLRGKAFSGISKKDLPFELSKNGDEALSGASGAIPVAVGKTSSKEALAGLMNAPSLQQANRTRVGLTQRSGSLGAGGETALTPGASRAPSSISGAGSAGIAPSGPAQGSLTDKSSGGSLIGRKLLGQGNGNPYSSGGIRSQPQEAVTQLSDTSESKRKISKSGDIEGEVGNRGVIKKVIPQYPAWAEEQGIVGTLKLFFTVSPEGNVRPNITVRQTTGYPALDQLGIDALKQWKFAPHTGGADAKDQWGLITFVFSLAS